MRHPARRAMDPARRKSQRDSVPEPGVAAYPPPPREIKPTTPTNPIGVVSRRGRRPAESIALRRGGRNARSRRHCAGRRTEARHSCRARPCAALGQPQRLPFHRPPLLTSLRPPPTSFGWAHSRWPPAVSNPPRTTRVSCLPTGSAPSPPFLPSCFPDSRPGNPQLVSMRHRACGMRKRRRTGRCGFELREDQAPGSATPARRQSRSGLSLLTACRMPHASCAFASSSCLMRIPPGCSQACGHLRRALGGPILGGLRL